MIVDRENYILVLFAVRNTKILKILRVFIKHCHLHMNLHNYANSPSHIL